MQKLFDSSGTGAAGAAVASSYEYLVPAPPEQRKRPLLAWLLSLLIPGMGQTYCGKRVRGIATTVFWSIGLAVLLWQPGGASPAEQLLSAVALRLVVVLYLFGTLDAFFTAREINSGADAYVYPNPRVAAVLNLTTRGFGYFYVGKRWQGFLTWVLIGAMNNAVMRATKSNANLDWLEWIAEAVMIIIAIHAYLMAAAEVKAALPPQAPTAEVQPTQSAALPLMIGSIFVAGYFGLAAIGTMLPDYENLDTSHAVVQSLPSGAIYEDGTYGFKITVPEDWDIAPKPEPGNLFQASFMGGACQVFVVPEAIAPWITDSSYATSLRQQVESQGKMTFVDQRKNVLGGRPATEVRYSGRIEDVLLNESFMFRRQRFTMYAFVSVVGADWTHECQPGIEQMQQDFAVQ